MTPKHQCEFFVLRYVPDPIKDEFVNVGVVLLEQGQQAYADVRFTRDWKRVTCISPDADTDLLAAFESDLRSRITDLPAGREAVLKQIEDSFSNSIQVSPSKAVLTDDPQAELGRLAQAYLERPRNRAAREASSREQIRARMKDEFERAGVWRFMQQNIKAADFTRKGDPLKIDCGYQPNGVVRFFHAVSLASDTNAAKVLAFSFPEFAAGVQRKTNAQAELTAIVDDELDRNSDDISFALDTLQRSSIAIAPAAMLPQIAEQARVELKI